MKITLFYLDANRTNFHMKSFAVLSLAFLMRFKATQKWPNFNLPFQVNKFRVQVSECYLLEHSCGHSLNSWDFCSC